jgi:hypothetical protein
MSKNAPALDKVYTALPADFVRTRNAVAKELADAGGARQAADVKRLRRPTVPVWALNQVARKEPRTLSAFVKAVQDLSKAQRSGTGVPAAIQAERDARQHVLARAEELIAGSALRATPDVARRISNTLLAAATDAGARDRLVRGELDEERTPSGFELFAGAKPVPPRREGPAARRPTQVQDSKRAQERARELEEIARRHRDEAEETAKKKARLQRELRALDATTRQAQQAAKAADKDARKERDKLRLVTGGRPSRRR